MYVITSLLLTYSIINFENTFFLMLLNDQNADFRPSGLLVSDEAAVFMFIMCPLHLIWKLRVVVGSFYSG